MQVLRAHSAALPWWLGYLDTGADDVVFPEAEDNDMARDQIAGRLGVTDPAATAILNLQLRRFSREAMRRVRDELRRLADE